MADDQDLAVAADAAHDSVLDRYPMRDADGEIRPVFVGMIADAVQQGGSTFLRTIVAELHEANDV